MTFCFLTFTFDFCCWKQKNLIFCDPQNEGSMKPFSFRFPCPVWLLFSWQDKLAWFGNNDIPISKGSNDTCCTVWCYCAMTKQGYAFVVSLSSVSNARNANVQWGDVRTNSKHFVARVKACSSQQDSAESPSVPTPTYSDMHTHAHKNTKTLSLSLSLSHTHTHTNVHLQHTPSTRTQMHTHPHTQRNTIAHTPHNTHSDTSTPPHSHAIHGRPTIYLERAPNTAWGIVVFRCRQNLRIYVCLSPHLR